MSRSILKSKQMNRIPVIPLSRHLLTPRKIQPLVSTNLGNSYSSQDFCASILDQNPALKTLKETHSKLITNHELLSKPSLCIKLMKSYAFHAETRSTRHIFDESPERNVVFFNVMIRSYMNNRLFHEAILVFKTMSRYGINPDNYTYPCVLKACSSSDNVLVGVQIHGLVLKVGLDSNLFVGNGLIVMYGRCRLLMDARNVFEEMPSRDVVSWNSLVAVYAQNGKFDDALEICKEMESFKVKHDPGTMASLLPAVTNTSFENVLFVKNMFLNMVNKKSLVSWNVMIAVYMNNSMAAEAIGLYTEMETHGIEPDPVTIASVLPACGDTSALFLGKQIHENLKAKKLLPNLRLENALIDIYAKCGCLDEARSVFDLMKSRDIVSWTSMISAYGLYGRGREAVTLFSKMQDSGLVPDAIAFVSILSACSHAGLLEEGQNLFRLMINRYKIIPMIEHFACMVDLLGRAGKLNEAYNFVSTMPMEPNHRVWGALLGACRVHSDTKIGIIAADKLFQLAPEQSAYYVLLSNVYAKAGRWEEVTTIRSIMKSKGMRKTPGASNFELDKKVHTFLVGDVSHPLSKEIYEELDVLVGKMKEAGYVPETDSALHDVEDEDKASHLAVHSEKLAIVFAILSTPQGTPIRITKNLRICGDCHIAGKLISKIAEREIVVRDTKRFHRFLNGVCSCGDYW